MPQTLGLTGIESAQPNMEECGLRPSAILNAAAGGAFDGAVGATLSRSTRNARGAGRAGLGTAAVSAIHETTAQLFERHECRANAKDQAEAANNTAINEINQNLMTRLVSARHTYRAIGFSDGQIDKMFKASATARSLTAYSTRMSQLSHSTVPVSAPITAAPPPTPEPIAAPIPALLAPLPQPGPARPPVMSYNVHFSNLPGRGAGFGMNRRF